MRVRDADTLRNVIFRTGQIAVSGYAYTITTDLRPKRTELMRWCRAFLKELVG
jgi:hypothetical protein